MDAFISMWQEETKDGFDAFATAMGLCPDKKAFYKEAKTAISYARKGDAWEIEVGMLTPEGKINGRKFEFTIGVPYDSANLDGTPMKSMIMIEDGKFMETHAMENIDNKMHIEREIRDGKMLVTTEYKGHTMTSVYSKV